MRQPIVANQSMSGRASEQILQMHSAVALDATVLLWGELRHVHEAAAMQSTYFYSTLGQFGYAFSDGMSVPAGFAIGRSVGELFEVTSSESCRLAALDSAWARHTPPLWSERIRGATLIDRERHRARLIHRSIASVINDQQPSTIIMIGYFPTLVRLLERRGYMVYCVDDGAGKSFPPCISIDELISDSLLVTTASYLCRADYLRVQALAQQARHSVLIAQTCHNMIAYHFAAGFDLVLSESFPPYSLVESELRCFHKL